MSDPQMTPSELETYFLSLVNQDRAAAGVKPLTFDGELLVSANNHSVWMDETDTFSHTGVNGSSPGDRITAAGYGATGWGENIAYTTGAMDKAAVEQLHQMLMNSPGHRANLLNAKFEEAGIGLHLGDINGHNNVVFVTENFGTPNAQERAEPNDVGTATGTTPVPTPVPEPGPAPTPQPDPAPTPQPDPAPQPDPVPQPTPTPILTDPHTFTFASLGQAKHGHITNFADGDKIDVHAIDAVKGAWCQFQDRGNQDFTLVDAFSRKGGELKVVVDEANNVTRVLGNTDHDLKAEFTITIAGVHHLTANDFIL